MNKRTPSSESSGRSSSNSPLAYFITFSCYGTRLHGNEKGSVDHEHNTFGAPFLKPDPARKKEEEQRMKQDPYHLDSDRRDVVFNTVHEVCDHRNWRLVALHVRINHVHSVVQGNAEPGSMLNDFKRYGSRRLNENGFDHPDRNRWAYHGSTKYLFEPDNVQNAIRYTLHEQGESMEVFLHSGIEGMSFESYDNRKNKKLRAFLQSYWSD